MPTIAIYDEYLNAYGRLPRAMQRRVREFHRRFRESPDDESLQYEHPADVRDANIRTVQVGPDCTAVVLRPPTSELRVLLWVDRDERARSWARGRTFTIHPTLGAIQVYDLDRLSSYLGFTVTPEGARTGAVGEGDSRARKLFPPADTLFAAIEEEGLVSAGVPRVLLPAVRALKSRKELDELGPYLPQEAHEALARIVGGRPLQETLADMHAGRVDEPVDASDFGRAIEHPASRRRFVVVSSDEHLEWILSAPLQRWRVFLHPSQERLAQGDFAGPVRVLGGAGTGKTVVAMHRARYLARYVFPSATHRVLLTTFTANLARNLRDLMEGFCGDEGARIDVVHLHAWVTRFLEGAGVDVQLADEESSRQTWRVAIGDCGAPELPGWVYEREWRQVIRSRGMVNLDEYLETPRTEGDFLTDPELGRSVWRVCERYLEMLHERGEVEWFEAFQKAAAAAREMERPPYRAVVVDEAQDFSPEELELVRSLVRPGANDLFLVGDAHQRIYDYRPLLSRAGIDVKDRSFKLKLNYRTTEQIRDWAVSLLGTGEADDLDGGLDDQRGYVSVLQGIVPEVRVCPGPEAEVAFVTGLLAETIGHMPAENICLVARTRRALAERFQPALKAARIPCVLLEQQSERDAGPGVRLATMHRVKGLEFSFVVVAGLSGEEVPARPPWFEELGPPSRERIEAAERRLLFVAATRARERLVLTAGGMPSELIVIRKAGRPPK